MNKFNSIGTLTNIYSNLSTIPLGDQVKFRLDEIIRIKDYFIEEIRERKIMSERLGKFIAGSDYIDKTLIVLSATSGSTSILSFARASAIPIEIASASFSLIFSLTAEVIKRLLKTTSNKRKKHNKVVMLAKSKLNSIGTLISQALVDLEIIHEDFKTIVYEKERCETMKENIRNIKSNDEKD